VSVRIRGVIQCDHVTVRRDVNLERLPGERCDALVDALFEIFEAWGETVISCVELPEGWCETQRPRLVHGCPRHRLNYCHHSDLRVGKAPERSDTEVRASLIERHGSEPR
jgi:hypothetical protein